MTAASDALLAIAGAGYEHALSPLLFSDSAQAAHERMLRMLRWMDARVGMVSVLRLLNKTTFPDQPLHAGGVTLPHAMMLAAGFVKGQGFASEDDALGAAARGENIMPGWRSVPALVGAVEFGSFTRWPRTGNSGQVLWRDRTTRSLQNRVGLKNPGALAAAEFLGRHAAYLPSVYGINIAPSPGVDDSEQEQHEIYEAVSAFVKRRVIPGWFTLNLSCPNTEDDPANRQTDARARAACGAALAALAGVQVPLWVKLSPALAETQYQTLLQVFAEIGVRAVVATNTLAQPTPDGGQTVAGVSGGRLHACAVEVVRLLADEKRRNIYPLDVIACGGAQDGKTYADYAAMGVRAVQYWSALVYRGPFAAALIQYEARKLGVFADDRSTN